MCISRCLRRISCGAGLWFAVVVACDAAASRPNVLFIAIDDLNDWIGVLGGHPQVKTPHIDALAARGTVFTNAHCQAPLCNPSRVSVLTGLRPSTTGIYGLAPSFRTVPRTRELLTLPQTFTQAGYDTFAVGKIYHSGGVAPAGQPAEFLVTGKAPPTASPARPIANVADENRHPAMDWGVWPEKDEETGDYKIATAAIQALRNAPADRPFFIAAGFRLPHVPCFAPKSWFDLYPEATLQMPPIDERDRDDTPRFSWYLHWKLPEPRLQSLRNTGEWRSLVRSYLATTSLLDAQIGRLLNALDESGRGADTLVVLWSDHGYHLGEKTITGKNTLWERSTRVPLIFAGPGVARNARSERPVELLDIFPTLLELAGLPERQDLEGHSLVSLLKKADAPRPWPAITTHNLNNHAVRTDRWRYIRYADGSEELYDMVADRHEWKNLAKDPAHSALKRELAKWLPKHNEALAPRSADRVLTYDPASGEVRWEGARVEPNTPVPQ